MRNEATVFSIRLTELMAERSMTQADLCRLTGLASSMISHYCTGQRIPSVPVAAQIAKAMNTTIDYLTYCDQTPPENDSGESFSVAEENNQYSSKPLSSEINPDEKVSFGQLFRLLNTTGQQKVLEYIKDLLSTGRYG